MSQDYFTRRGRLQELLDRVCAECDISKEHVLSRNRARWLVEVRRQFARQAREQRFSYPEIGAALGRHHSTIMSLVGWWWEKK